MLRYSSPYLNLLVFEGAYPSVDLRWSLDDWLRLESRLLDGYS